MHGSYAGPYAQGVLTEGYLRKVPFRNKIARSETLSFQSLPKASLKLTGKNKKHWKMAGKKQSLAFWG